MISLLRRIKHFFRKYGFWLFAIIWPLILVINEQNDPFFSFGLFFYFVIMIIIAVGWVIRQRTNLTRLKKEQKQMELQHLKSQVNPHFFFNTLNNLFGLIDKDSEKAKDMVLKLSDMMRYSIYEGQNEYVNLEDELKYIQDYVDLHKSRYHKEINVHLHHHLPEDQIAVMPLLFIILLENAFKHGVENLREDAYVNIYLSGSENEVIFSVENNFDKETLPDKPGIGLSNLKRRLELVYPDKHELSWFSEEDVFKAQLTLHLK